MVVENEGRLNGCKLEYNDEEEIFLKNFFFELG